jgi:glycosyltransferase involved in cell wall biosynthesis
MGLKITMIDPGNFSPLYDANLCHCLAARGHEVELETSKFLFEPVPPLDGYHVNADFFDIFEHFEWLEHWTPVRQAAKAAVYPIDMARWAARAMRSVPDVLHVQWSLLPVLDLRLFRLLQRRGARVVATAHDVQPLPGSTWSRAGFAQLYRLADAVVVHAEASRRQLVGDLHVPANRIHRVPMGGPGAYAEEPSLPADARRRLGLQPDALYLLFFGLIKPHKGLDLLLDALAIARRDRPDLRLLVAGEPMGPWRPYERQIANLGLSRSLDLHLGFVPNNDAALWFSAADLVVLPYREIFQSGVALAAYTFGRPVVATPVGGLPELVEEGVTGFLAQRADPSALAETLVRATADRARLSAMGTAAAALAHGPHSWERIAARHEEIYEASAQARPGVQR